MEWIGRLNSALDYIEDNLDGEIDIERAAKIAACSAYHFQRMFSYIADMPLSEYVRRRKMTAAALELANGSAKVIDLALKYGYDSPTAFNRAFRSVHGIAPSAARKAGAPLKAFPRIIFSISIKGEAEMNFKMEHKPAFRIVGAKLPLDGMDVEESMKKVPLFWQKNAGIIPALCTLMDKSGPMGIMGISFCNKTENQRYFIASASEKPVLEGMAEDIVPESDWAVFECVGAMPNAMHELQRRVITEWLPSSGCEYADAPDIEVYPEGDLSSPEYKCEFWLPVVKK